MSKALSLQTNELRLLALRRWHTFINYKVDNISIYVCLTGIVEITRKTNLSI